jgi:hypothetical protein
VRWLAWLSVRQAGPGSILGSASMEVLLADQKSNEENRYIASYA